jgi:hypothetical protein
MLVGQSVGWSVGWLVCPHITSKTDYVAIPLRLGFGDNLVLSSPLNIVLVRLALVWSDTVSLDPFRSDQIWAYLVRFRPGQIKSA